MEIGGKFADSIVARTLPWAILAVAAAFVALYFGAVGPYWKITPDSTTYVLGAQSLAEGKGYREAGAPAPLFPPGTSALLAGGWLAGGKSYRALNAEAMLFTLAAMVICFLLFRHSLGTVGSGVVVLLCLGSTEIFDSSTFLLSETFFLFFSLLALWRQQRDDTIGAVLSTLAACMVRSVGVALAAALLVDSLRKGPRRLARSAGYLLPLLFIAGWEVRNRLRGWSYTKLMLQSEPWTSAGGQVTPGHMISRLVGNFAYGRAFEDVLTNGLTKGIGWAILPGILLGLLFAVGFWRLFRSGNSAAGIYFILFFTTVALYWQDVVVRLMEPVLPLMFGYLAAGVQAVAVRRNLKWIYAPALVFLALYLVTGFRQEMAIAAADSVSPFPDQPVKYVGNEDIERLALWWKAHAGESDRYACRHPGIIGAVTGRAGINYPQTDRPEALEEGMRSNHIRFLLLDLKSGADRQLALVAERSANFHLTRQEGRARLYEFSD